MAKFDYGLTTENGQCDFDSVLPVPLSSIEKIPKRIHLNGKWIELENTHSDVMTLFKAIYSVISSDWWLGLGDRTKKTRQEVLIYFFSWLNKKKVEKNNRYLLLEDFQAYRVNDAGVKPQSTGLKIVLTILKRGVSSKTLNSSEQEYLKLLLKSTKISKPDVPEPITLTGWFASMNWLRNFVDEDDWLTLESPKRLIESFSITVATALLEVINIKKEILNIFPNQETLDSIQSTLKISSNKIHESRYFPYKFINFIILNSDTISPLAVDIMLCDFVSPKHHSLVKQCIKEKIEAPFRYQTVNEKTGSPVLSPGFFSPNLFKKEHLTSLSVIEQWLFAWLCAWQTVQPTDISKLTQQDFVISRNRMGRPVAMQCVYYKGRSQTIHELPILDAASIEAKAILACLELRQGDNNPIIASGLKSISFVSDGFVSISVRIKNLFQLPYLSNTIVRELNRRNASDRFRRIFMALMKNCSENYPTWQYDDKTQTRSGSYEEYCLAVDRPTPCKLFGLASIKTSAIHARSDHYRDGDLVNGNSHTSATEKTAYLTDDNKEWVNQNGRITRIVLDDIENYVYQPNLDAAVSKAREKALKTKVQSVTNSSRPVKINMLGEADIYSDDLIPGVEQDQIIVWDTPETVLHFLHYLSETKRQQTILINHAIFFFERTVLPTCEWMSWLLSSRMSKESVKEGKRKYNKIKHKLPSLFTSPLQGGIGS